MSRLPLLPLVACAALLLVAVSAANPPVIGSFGDPLQWCPPVKPSASVPTNVNALRPSDVKVIAALGDSITAGFGIDGFWGSFTEDRGKSWAMGGDANVSSLASFIRRYSPSVQGASVGRHWVEICADYFCPSAHVPSIDNLNAAQSGAWVQNLPAQATWLIERIQDNHKIDWKNDWKLITVLIGANNLCASCIDWIDPFDTAQQFGEDLDKTLATLATIPRSFINVVQIFNLSSVWNVSSTVSYCNVVHEDFPLECECDFDSAEDVRTRHVYVENKLGIDC